MEEDKVKCKLAKEIASPPDKLTTASKSLCSIFIAGKPHVTPDRTDPAFCFCAKRVPDISIHDYLQRFVKYTECSPQVVVLAAIYIDRFPTAFRNALNFHRLLATALMIAQKFFDDLFYTNKCFSLVAGIEVSELNCLELEMVKYLNCHLFVEPELFASVEKLVFT